MTLTESNMKANDLFNTPTIKATCRTCIHRERWHLNNHSNKIIQCCRLQPSKRSNSGYKTIKVTDKACFRYEQSKHYNKMNNCD